MLRMARAAGCDTYEAFRAPFQRALTQGMEAGWRDRAARLQARRAETPAVDARAALTRWQTAALESIGAVSTPTPPSTKPPPRCWPPARPASWAPLGLRHRLPDALCLQMLCRNGMLIGGLGGASSDRPIPWARATRWSW